MAVIMNRLVQPLLKTTKLHRRSQFEALPQPVVDVVFIGDSITEGGLWDEWFPNVRTANRGIGGETSGEVIVRLDSLVAQARLIFILIGTNDLALGIPAEQIAANVRAIVNHVKRVTPEADVVIQSVMPRKKAFRHKVAALNLLLASTARLTETHYLDLWPALAGPDGAIRAGFSLDELHLNGAGYRQWVRYLTPFVDRLSGGPKA